MRRNQPSEMAVKGGDLQTEGMPYQRPWGKKASEKKKLKMDQGSKLINGANTVILTATSVDPLISRTNLLEHVSCWPSFYITSYGYFCEAKWHAFMAKRKGQTSFHIL